MPGQSDGQSARQTTGTVAPTAVAQNRQCRTHEKIIIIITTIIITIIIMFEGVS